MLALLVPFVLLFELLLKSRLNISSALFLTGTTAGAATAGASLIGLDTDVCFLRWLD